MVGECIVPTQAEMDEASILLVLGLDEYDTWSLVCISRGHAASLLMGAARLHVCYLFLILFTFHLAFALSLPALKT